MGVKHVIEAGDCIASVALTYGFDPRVLWLHSDNARLREQRSSGYVLAPGDVLAIPPLTPRVLSCRTDQRHVFRRTGVPEKLRIRFVDDGEPRAGRAWTLLVDGHETRGVTDAQGNLESWIRPDARRGTLSFDDAPPIRMMFGQLPPVTEPGGVAARLYNLGHLDSDAADDANAVPQALLAFQVLHGLPATGEADDATRQTLLAQHGC